MGYLGTSLDDYYSFQLIEFVISQIEEQNLVEIGDLEKLKESNNKLQKILKEKYPDVAEMD